MVNSEHKANKKKSKKIFKYDKGKYDDDFIKLLIKNHDEAIKFAKKNFEKASNNPSTKIYKLFECFKK